MKLMGLMKLMRVDEVNIIDEVDESSNLQNFNPKNSQTLQLKIYNSENNMKTLVNIFDVHEPLAAYLFLKQYYEEGDRLLFISARDTREAVAPYLSLLHVPQEQVEYVSFKRSLESYIYERICRRLRSCLSHEREYWVNLAGGTRYFAMAVQHVFQCFDTRFFYVQTRENVVVSSFFDDSIDDNDDVVEPIRYRMSMAEYFELNGLEHDLRRGGHRPIRSEEDALRVFDCFRQRRLSDRAFSAIEQLRLHYRGSNRTFSIESIVRGVPHRREGIAGVRELLTAIGFVPKESGRLSPDEVDYLTGGWFEEYVYYRMSRLVRPQEIALGVRIARPGSQHNNELDVVFVKANTLFVVECKTGIATDHMFNEIVYKACALRESFLGMACHSYIFTLKNDYDHRLQEVSEMMGVRLCPKGVLASEERMAAVAEEMRKVAHEE